MNTSQLRALLEKKGADAELTFQLLNQVNRGDIQNTLLVPDSFPAPDGQDILDMQSAPPGLPEESVRQAFHLYFSDLCPEDYGKFTLGFFYSTPEQLMELGLRLLGKTAYGVLNGGSATSYGDEKKNRSYGDKLFEIYQKPLNQQAQDYEGKPKGITPAFIHPDGTPGPSFMEIKIRAIGIQALYHFWLTGKVATPEFFQMTSRGTHDSLLKSLEEYKTSPLLEPLIQAAGWGNINFKTEIQGLIGTFTPLDSLGKREIFTFATDQGLDVFPLPGGHGQNFRVLEPLYRSMNAQGYEFAYIGNVDNLGYLPDPLSLALLALKGSSGGFDFSFKTPVDVKGGVLYKSQEGRLNCGDIGVALSKETVEKAGNSGKTTLLFNCATGVFNLTYLIDNLDNIIKNLPLRLSEQDKDVGKYAQVEQVTWEVLGLMDNPLIFAVEKSKRFLAAKLLIESFITSGWKFSDPKFQTPELVELKKLAQQMNQGLQNLLQGPYGFKLQGERWVPLSVQELRDRFETRGLKDLRA
ncbi:MAG: hypothetical protein A2Z96_00845 [Spirochaetes bacterium GWB1_48_6]|nr:MAG: hypothetical protein A2Z96_00845 [Spirochaetes bacterium GWB1_48_6]